MPTAKDVTVSLKVVINKQKTKVLFAEADSDFIDILLSFLTLPLGKIAKLLDDHYGNDDDVPSVGSLSNLYRSVAKLDDSRFVNEGAKKMLLDPRSPLTVEDARRNLKLDISDTQPTQYFTCAVNSCNGDTSRAQNICMYFGSGSCDNCRIPLCTEIKLSDAKAADAGGFTLNTASFVVCDDLHVEPYGGPGFLKTLTNFGVGDTQGAEIRNVSFGIDQIIGLLKCCLLSETPLTDLILNKTQKPSSAAKTSLKAEKKEASNSENIILKITLQKSTNKLLFAEADDDFVELLFSFLTIPLGGVESLLNNNTCLKNIDNLYRSLSDSIHDKYFTTPTTKTKLMNPKLAAGFSYRKQFFPLCIYKRELYYKQPDVCAVLVPSFKFPNGLGNYMKEPTKYLVSDDLTVCPFGMTTGVIILDNLNIPLCDVVELEVHIGLEEALGIPRASLTSTSALSSVLINQMPNKPPKLIHDLVGQIV